MNQQLIQKWRWLLISKIYKKSYITNSYVYEEKTP